MALRGLQIPVSIVDKTKTGLKSMKEGMSSVKKGAEELGDTASAKFQEMGANVASFTLAAAAAKAVLNEITEIIDYIDVHRKEGDTQAKRLVGRAGRTGHSLEGALALEDIEVESGIETGKLDKVTKDITKALLNRNEKAKVALEQLDLSFADIDEWLEAGYSMEEISLSIVGTVQEKIADDQEVGFLKGGFDIAPVVGRNVAQASAMGMNIAAEFVQRQKEYVEGEVGASIWESYENQITADTTAHRESIQGHWRSGQERDWRQGKVNAGTAGVAFSNTVGLLGDIGGSVPLVGGGIEGAVDAVGNLAGPQMAQEEFGTASDLEFTPTYLGDQNQMGERVDLGVFSVDEIAESKVERKTGVTASAPAAPVNAVPATIVTAPTGSRQYVSGGDAREWVNNGG